MKKLFLGVLILHYSAEVGHGLQEKDTQTVDQLVAELEASGESRPFIARIRILQDKVITGKPWMKRPQEPLATMKTGGSLSKSKDGGYLAGWIGFGLKVMVGGNQGANSLTPGFTCHYFKEVGYYKRNCPIALSISVIYKVGGKIHQYENTASF